MICLGTRKADLSEWLMLSALPAKLRAADPGAGCRYLRRGFGSAVFRGNPSLTGGVFFPPEITSLKDGLGEGHPIQRLERRLRLPVSEQPHPELHLTERERARARSFLENHCLPGNEGKPILIVHPWGPGVGDPIQPVAPVDFWDKLVAKWKSQFRFWQVGLIGQGAVVGCEYYYWLSGSPRSYRKAFAIIEQAKGYVGAPCPAMHVAAAFQLPSFVTLSERQADAADVYPQAKRLVLHPSFEGDLAFNEQAQIDTFLADLISANSGFQPAPI